MAYSETVLDHFQSPRNLGEIAESDADAEDENPVCGDRLRIWLRIENDAIREIRWKAQGCAPAIAAASAASELARGRTLQEARSIDREAVDRALGGLPARKAHAAMLAVSTLRKALDQFESRRQ